jgi:hypothetical protein
MSSRASANLTFAALAERRPRLARKATRSSGGLDATMEARLRNAVGAYIGQRPPVGNAIR